MTWTKIAGALAAGALMVSTAAMSAPTEPDKKAERLWKAKCGSCHGADGKAQSDQGKKLGVRDMTLPAYQKEVTDARFTKSLTEGVKNAKGEVVMEAYADLTPEQQATLLNYMRWLGK